MAQRSKLCEANSEQTILGTARGRDVGSSSLFTPTKRKRQVSVETCRFSVLFALRVLFLFYDQIAIARVPASIRLRPRRAFLVSFSLKNM